jgi:hypothetical protein
MGIFLFTTASVSYPMGTRGSFPGGKAPGCEADHSPPSSAEVKEWVDLYLNSPNTSSWRGVQLKAQGQIYLYLYLHVQYKGVFKSFRTESITKYTLTIINTRWEATQRVMATKLTRLTHKIAIQLHLVAESFTICSSRPRRPVRKSLDTRSYIRSEEPKAMN